MKAQEIMNTDTCCCSANDTLTDVARQMREHDVGDVLVIDENRKLLGIVTDRDIVLRCVADGQAPDKARAGDCMSAPTACLSEDAGVEEVANLMAARQLRRVPIIDAQNALCGIISLADIQHSGSSSREHVAQRVATPH